MADGLARAHSFSFFVHPIQRLCYRSNWFQEILSSAVSLFSTSFIHRFSLCPFPTLSAPLSLFKEKGWRIQKDRKTMGSVKGKGGKEERNRGEGRGEKRVERRTSSSRHSMRSPLSSFDTFFPPLFRSVSYHAVAALSRVAPREESRRIDYRATT